MKAVITLACAMFVALPSPRLEASSAVTPQAAVAAAVAERLGVPASVVVTDLETTVEPAQGLTAEPEAAARTGRRARFVLFVQGARRGVAVATVKVTVAYARAARSIARDEEIGRDAVLFNEGELPSMPIRPLLTEERVIGLKARRAIRAGEPLLPSVLWVPPVVKSGDEVAMTLRIGAVQVTASGIASGSGQVGDIIRMTQPNSSRLLKGRITGPGAVEIVQ